MECLVTKLKGTVNDSSLLGLNEIRFRLNVRDTSCANLQLSCVEAKPFNLKVLNNIGGISLSKGSYVKELSVNSSSLVQIYFENTGVYELSISNKHNVTYIWSSEDISKKYPYFDMNFEELEWCENLYSFIVFCNKEFTRPIENIEKIASRYVGTEGVNIQLTYGTINGDLASFLEKNVTRLYGPYLGDNIKGTLNKLPKNLRLLQNNSNTGRLDSDVIIYDASHVSELSVETNVGFNNFNLKSFENNTKMVSLQLGSVVVGTRKRHFKGDLSLLKNTKIRTLYLKEFVQDDDAGLTLSSAPNDFYFLTSGITSSMSVKDKPKCKWDKNSDITTVFLAVESVYFVSGTADYIKAMANKPFYEHSGTIQPFERIINIALADDLTSSAASSDGELQTAISTLQGKGVTVSIGYSGTAANGIALMSALDVDVPKYGIVYKGKELIIEPADTSKTLIAPAYDCTYKEFNSLEEAKAFISSNGLVKVESK